jgi:hypothetical protein
MGSEGGHPPRGLRRVRRGWALSARADQEAAQARVPAPHDQASSETGGCASRVLDWEEERDPPPRANCSSCCCRVA